MLLHLASPWQSWFLCLSQATDAAAKQRRSRTATHGLHAEPGVMAAWDATISFDSSARAPSRLASRQASRRRPGAADAAAGDDDSADLGPQTPGHPPAYDRVLSSRRSKVQFHHSETELRGRERLLCHLESDEYMDEDATDACERPESYLSPSKSMQDARGAADREDGEIKTLVDDAADRAWGSLGETGAQEGSTKGKRVNYSSSVDVVSRPVPGLPAQMDESNLMRCGAIPHLRRWWRYVMRLESSPNKTGPCGRTALFAMRSTHC